MNPYYEPDKLGLEMLAFDEPDLCYAYNKLCFWATPDGQVYTASDSGCSCPVPFENHDRATAEEVMQTLERVGSVEQAEATFDAWVKGQTTPSFGADERRRLTEWMCAKLKV